MKTKAICLLWLLLTPAWALAIVSICAVEVGIESVKYFWKFFCQDCGGLLRSYADASKQAWEALKK